MTTIKAASGPTMPEIVSPLLYPKINGRSTIKINDTGKKAINHPLMDEWPRWYLNFGSSTAIRLITTSPSEKSVRNVSMMALFCLVSQLRQ